MKTEQGQTIIEVLVALMVSGLIMGALAIAVVISLRNAQFSQNQTQATKLAQDAVETIRTMRNRDMCIKLKAGGNCAAFVDAVSFTTFLGDTSRCATPCYFNLNKADLILTLEETSGGDSVYTQPLDNTFKQQVIVENLESSTNTKKFTIKIQWTDSSGLHESNIQTFLTRL